MMHLLLLGGQVPKMPVGSWKDLRTLGLRPQILVWANSEQQRTM